ncbi:MAG: hypothetical protein ACKPKO_39700, partial [Candidatus Fonsibacter sp.]
YITDVSIPVSFFTIEEARNNKLYYRVNNANIDVAAIPDGNYNTVSLNNAIADLMNLFYPYIQQEPLLNKSPHFRASALIPSL